MSRRFQITLSEEQYAYMNAEANRSSVSVAELFRRAAETVHGPQSTQRVVQITHTLGRRAGLSLDRYSSPSQ